MVKNYFFTWSSLLVMLLFVAGCSPKYGAHFAPAKHDAYAGSDEYPTAVVTAPEQTPLLAAEPAEVPGAAAKRAEEAGVETVVLEPVAPVPATEAVVSVKKQQKKVLRELRQKLKHMSKAEREVFGEQVLHQLQQQHLSNGFTASDAAPLAPPPADIDPVLLTIITIFIPPLGVYLHQGVINEKFWISLVLTILFFIPGLIYSLLVIFDKI